MQDPGLRVEGGGSGVWFQPLMGRRAGPRHRGGCQMQGVGIRTFGNGAGRDYLLFRRLPPGPFRVLLLPAFLDRLRVLGCAFDLCCAFLRRCLHQ